MALTAMVLLPGANAGSFIGSSLIPEGVTFPKGYTGSQSVVTVDVCIVPGSPNAELMEPAIQNSVAVWNNRVSSSANLRSTQLAAGLYDFESLALHEIGHCIGLGHPNLGFGAGGGNENFTQSMSGADGVLSLQAGVDGIAGTADDNREDDRNTHYFHSKSNNPFFEPEIIDATTYSNDVASLPVGDLFSSNASRDASVLPRYSTPFSEAVMQQGAFESEVQRTLAHDDVSTLRYAMSGLDKRQGTADDYDVVMNYAGISASEECGISVAMDASKTGFAVCNVIPKFMGTDLGIADAKVFFNPNINWYYNNEPPCSQTITLPEGAWVTFSPPCNMGVSSPASLLDLFGDDLDASQYKVEWIVYEYVYTAQADGRYLSGYETVELTDQLHNGRGYWILNINGPVVINIQGEYSSQLDTRVYIDSARSAALGWNFIGQPFRFPVVWADTSVIDLDGRVLSLLEADPVHSDDAQSMELVTACNHPSGPLDGCTVAQQAFSYNSELSSYELLDMQSGVIASGTAVWVYAAKTNASVRFTMPELERSTP